MAAAKEKTITLLGTATSVSLSTGNTTIFTVPTGKVSRVTHVCFRDVVGTMNGTGSVHITGWRQTIVLPVIAAGTGYAFVYGAETAGVTASYTEQAAATAIQVLVNATCGTTITATVDIFGYLSN